MGARYYFKKREMVIEGDHIVMARFEPAHDVEADPARVIITMDSIELDNEYGYEGTVNGTASKSVEVVVFGRDAEEFWKLYANEYHAQMIGGVLR